MLLGAVGLTLNLGLARTAPKVGRCPRGMGRWAGGDLDDLWGLVDRGA